MNEAQSLFAEIGHICGPLRVCAAQPYVCAALTLVLLFGALLFPPRNGPDQA